MGIMGGIRFLGAALSHGVMVTRGLKLWRSLNRAIDGGIFCSEFLRREGAGTFEGFFGRIWVILALQLNPVVNNLP